MIKFYWEKYGRAGLLGLLAVLIFSPYLLHPQYSLLDDPWYYLHAQDATRAAVLMQDRAITFSVWFYDAVFRVADFNITAVMVIRCLELWLLAFLIYRLILSLGGNKNRATWGSIFFLVAPALMTNFYELETQDHISLLLLLVFFFAYFTLLSRREFKSGRSWILALAVIASLALFLLTKEINIFLLPVFALAMLLDWRRKEYYRLAVNAVLFVLGILWLVWLLVFLDKAGTGSYALSHVWSTLRGYIVILNFNILLLALYLYSWFKDRASSRRNLLSGQGADYDSAYRRCFLFWAALGSFLIYLPWGSSADRYLLLPVSLFYILFFSADWSRVPRRLVYLCLALVMASSLFFSYFHIVRFYGQRVGDWNIMSYLEEKSGEYDQICVTMPKQSMEDLLEIDIWVNEIKHLNKKVCGIFPEGALDKGGLALLDTQKISYGDSIKLDGLRTLVLAKDYSGIEVYSPSVLGWSVEPRELLSYEIFGIHPTRGPERKHFNWSVGTIK